MSDDFDAEAGQKGLEDHYAQWFEQIDSDFRATNLNRLVVALTPAGKVLDLGCGSGALSAELVSAGHEVTSQDLSERMVEMCRLYLERRGHDGSRVRLGGAEDIPEREQFDAVIALDVIEHIEDDLDAVQHMKAALKPTGRLVLSVPALSWLYGPKDVEVGHFRRYDKPALLSLLDRAGFELESCRYWNALGVLPVWVSVKRNKRLDESLRYGDPSLPKRALKQGLRWWFRWIENPVRPPLGMTLLVTARQR